MIDQLHSEERELIELLRGSSNYRLEIGVLDGACEIMLHEIDGYRQRGTGKTFLAAWGNMRPVNWGAAG